MTVSSEGGGGTAVEVTPLGNAIQSLKQYEDAPRADLASLIGVNPNNWVASLSGINDHDYPNAPAANATPPVLHEALRVPLPVELAEQFNHMQVDWKIGLFTEIGRAWLTIDADIFIWKYQNGEDLAYFDQLSESIVAVQLVRPIPGIFKPQIKYLLVVATSVEVIILGICFTGDDLSELTIIPDPLFTVSTEGILFHAIQGTPDGRIFLAGRDGCLHEVIYSAEKGWFGRRCRRVNLSKSKLNFLLPTVVQNAIWEEDPLARLCFDAKRQLLWSASEKGSLTLYDLAGASLSKVYSLSIANIVSAASKAAPQVDRQDFQPLVHVSVIEPGASRSVHLVAITQSGIRLYFTTGSSARPTTVTLSHVRLPPGYTSATAELKPRRVHTALSLGQVTLLSSEDMADVDLVWSLVAQPSESSMPEEYAVSKLDGRVWCCAAIEDEQDALVPVDSTTGLAPPRNVSSLYQAPSEFVLMTAHGTSIYRSLSGAEQLLQILRSSNGMETPELERFLLAPGKDAEATCSCIQLACDPTVDPQTQRWATLAYFRYGGEPKRTNQPLAAPTPATPTQLPPTQILRPNLSSMFSPIQSRTQLHTNVASTPMPSGKLPQPVSMDSTMLLTREKITDVANSAKYRGLAVYLSRVLRPVWAQPIVVKEDFQSRLGFVDLGRVLNSLAHLRAWMEANNIGTAALSAQTSVDVVSFEAAQLNSLYQLLLRAQEVLALWQLLTKYEIGAVAKRLDGDEQRRQLSTLTCCQIVSTQDGFVLCQRLITVLVSCFLDDNASIGPLSEQLRQICPTLFSSDDAVRSKATEILAGARHHSNRAEQRAKCQESLGLFMQIAAAVNLEAVTRQFASVQFWDGIVTLTIECAQKRDPQGLALHYYRNGEPREDTIGEAYYAARRECYAACLAVVKDLVDKGKQTPASPSLPASPGQKPKTNKHSNIVMAQEARDAAEEMLQCILKSEDELFHVYVYNWLFGSDLVDKLLVIQSPFLESYLKRITQNQSISIAAHDLLWRYYNTISQYGLAASVLLQLAECDKQKLKAEDKLSLSDRLDYLSRAVVAASAILSPTPAEEQLHREIQEKVEVGAIQQLIQRVLQEKGETGVLGELDDNLYDLTHLCREYAEAYDLPEVKLAIVHCAGQFDEAEVQGFWQEIIEKEVLLRREMPLQTQLAALRNKVLELGQRYHSSGRYLPVVFIAHFLEKVSCHLGLSDEPWVVDTLVKIDLPLVDVLDTYDQIYQNRDEFWATIGRPLHLVKMQQAIFNLFLEQLNVVPASERRLFIDRCLQIISSLNVHLGAMSNDLAQLAEVKHGLKQTQYRLERMLQ